MKKIFGFLGFMFVCFFLSGTVFAQDIAQAVVKIYTVYNSYDYFEPWQMIGQRTKTGSGCVIEGKRILTNAHVVADQTFIQVRKSGDANKYIAKVEMVAHECDLAILMVEDEKFFDGIVPLALGELAKVRDKVAVYGFPKGGDRLSITEGVVSRVEHQEYTHSNANLLTCQIDAAINPGSSGGPVIKDGKIVGVAFQAGEGENIGYMVPAPIVRHFLSDIKDKKYDGTPELGVQWEKMENPDLRENYGMKDEQTGVLITDVYSGSSADGNLKIGDVVLSVDNIDIASDGTIEFRKGERTFWGYVFQNKYIGDSINFKILRDKKIENIKLALVKPINFSRLVPHEQYDRSPTYFIKGGLVFQPLTNNFLDQSEQKSGVGLTEYLLNCYNYYFYGKPTKDRKEIVLLSRILADEINVGYQDWEYKIISKVNGKPVSSIQELVNLFTECKDKYYVIEEEQGNILVLNKDKVDKNSDRILEKYKIGSDRSGDLE